MRILFVYGQIVLVLLLWGCGSSRYEKMEKSIVADTIISILSDSSLFSNVISDMNAYKRYFL